MKLDSKEVQTAIAELKKEIANARDGKGSCSKLNELRAKMWEKIKPLSSEYKELEAMVYDLSSESHDFDVTKNLKQDNKNNTPMQTKADLKELETSLASLKEGVIKAKAEMNSPDMDEKMKQMHETMYRAFDSLYAYCDKIKEMVYKVSDNSWGMMDEHMEKSTHLPKLNAEQIQALLKSCGAEKSFDVVKPVIYARANVHGGKVIEVDFQKQKK